MDVTITGFELCNAVWLTVLLHRQEGKYHRGRRRGAVIKSLENMKFLLYTEYLCKIWENMGDSSGWDQIWGVNDCGILLWISIIQSTFCDVNTHENRSHAFTRTRTCMQLLETVFTLQPIRISIKLFKFARSTYSRSCHNLTTSLLVFSRVCRRPPLKIFLPHASGFDFFVSSAIYPSTHNLRNN